MTEAALATSTRPAVGEGAGTSTSCGGPGAKDDLFHEARSLATRRLRRAVGGGIAVVSNMRAMPAPRTVLSVVGARPNFMKMAPIIAELQRRPEEFDSVLVHTGQHYDDGDVARSSSRSWASAPPTTCSTSAPARTRSRPRA